MLKKYNSTLLCIYIAKVLYNNKSMTEAQFTQELIECLAPAISDAKVGSGISVLYEMPIDDDGIVHMGVDADSGEPIRGHGTGFEQDILIYEEKNDGHTSIIPRVIVEVKYANVTTHDAIVYSYKAERIKRIYPFCRYGMLIGGKKTIPGRVLRHGRSFDFIFAMVYPFEEKQINQVCKLLVGELATSRLVGLMMRGKKKLQLVQHQLIIADET
jgi:hypothetical protein